MKKILFLFMGLLALTSCMTDVDEPHVVIRPVTEAMLLATPGFLGYPEMIYDQNGDTVYECGQADHILSLLAEGADWYASISTDGGTCSVVKNGKRIYTTTQTILNMAVENGIVYTVQQNGSSDTYWVYKDFEPLYEFPNNVNYYALCVNQGNISFTVNSDKPYTWWNGKFIQFEGLDDGFGYTYGFDTSGNNSLIVFQGYNSEKYMYIWNGTVNVLPKLFAPKASRLINGHAFILGRQMTSQGVGGNLYVPAVIIDGVVTILDDDLGFAAVQAVAHEMDTYILVKDMTGRSSWSTIYRNMQKAYMPNNILIPEDLRNVYQSADGMSTSLNILGITAMAIVEKNTD